MPDALEILDAAAQRRKEEGGGVAVGGDKPPAVARLAQSKWAGWLDHTADCPRCRADIRGCPRGRTLYQAWKAARTVSGEEETTA
ncbi:hypothetical protein [Streptomyces gobiensis]|uniref:hypothetical protein n=1 Tax=Streptomyces gobiensis TaxID=2875706 RepID=UPI001E3AAB8E|nr:hypothetical protein [Streptomyces gobiensis]UGY93933.1 hypothetical protein test1122_20905 [Streptomyces gobiensis]